MTEIEVLMKEYELIVGSINEFINSQFRIINAGILIFTASFAVATKTTPVVFAFIPFGMLVLITYFIFRLQRNSFLQEYRNYLENQISLALGREIEDETIFYGKIATAHLRNGNILSIFQIFYYIIAYIFSSYLAYIYIKNDPLFEILHLPSSIVAKYVLGFYMIMMVLLIIYVLDISLKAKFKFNELIPTKRRKNPNTN